MSQGIQDKDKKIADLRALLTQAKAKIEDYKAQVVQKQKQNEDLKKQFKQKIKLLQGDSQNIIKQYEQRLVKYQKTLQQSNQIIDKHHKGMQNASKNYDEVTKKISTLYSITNKIFFLTPSREKQNSDAVEELCQIQKCKEYIQNIQKFAQLSDLEILIKMLTLITKNNLLHLNKRRQQRIQSLKKQTQLQKNIQQQKLKLKGLQNQIIQLKKELTEVRDKHQKQIDAITINKQKYNEEKTNEEFVKQLLIKMILGPKDATFMAFGILAKVLKLNTDEIKSCQKKLK